MAVQAQRAGRFADAEAACRQLVALNPQQVDAHYLLGLLALQQRNPDEAIATFRRALQANPRHFSTLMNFGALLRQVNDFDGAVEQYEKAVQADPNSADAHEKLARALWSLVRTDDAVKHYAIALKLAPSPSPRLRVTIATLVPPIYKSEDDVIAWRKRLVDQVDALHRDRVKLDLTNETAPNIVYLPYQGLEDREIAEK